MRTFFHPCLPNGLSGDPLLWVGLLDLGHALLLDLGDVHLLAPRKLLRVNRVVVTHTHMDHFVGFDPLLRLLLRRDKELTLSGPAGFIDNVRGKLAGYTWNLIEDYPLRLRVEELDGESVRSVLFSATTGFDPEPLQDRSFDGTLHAEETYRVDATVLDHGVPVLGVALREVERLAVDKDRLHKIGLEPGPWLNDLKSAVRRGCAGHEEVEALASDGSVRRIRTDQLAADVLSRAPGQEVAYLTDFGCSTTNVERAVNLARGVQLLVCEAAFLHRDEALARERHHLTARQAGELAREAGAKTLALFHVSPRYDGQEEELLEEAATAFEGPVVRLPRVV